MMTFPTNRLIAETSVALAHSLFTDARFVHWFQEERVTGDLTRQDQHGGFGGFYPVVVGYAEKIEEAGREQAPEDGWGGTVDFYLTMDAVAEAIVTDNEPSTEQDYINLLVKV